MSWPGTSFWATYSLRAPIGTKDCLQYVRIDVRTVPVQFTYAHALELTAVSKYR